MVESSTGAGVHDMPSLLECAAGSYKILPGGAAYCTGIVP